MRVTSIQGRMGLIFLAFVLLISVSVAATFWGINAQRQDALIINLAGRQRMLAQQMTRHALQLRVGSDPQTLLDLQEAERTFGQTLAALKDGGRAPYQPGKLVELPATHEPVILAQLDSMQQTWSGFQAALQILRSSASRGADFSSAFQTVEETSPLLLEQADQVVRLFEAQATRKVNRLQMVQAGFFGASIVLLLFAGWLTRRSIIEPLRKLGESARRMGQGNLETAVDVTSPDEVRLLAENFETMRVQLQASRQELLTWAERLEKRVDQRTRELEALYEVSRTISSKLDIEFVLSSVTEKARDLLEADAAVLCLLDEETGCLKFQSLSGPSDAVLKEQTKGLHGQVAKILTAQEAVACHAEVCNGACGIMSPVYKSNHLAAPLQVGDGVIGALCVGVSNGGPFDLDARRSLTKLASSAAVALENARLYTQAERIATLEERQRIAAEMHDGLGQTLSFLGLTLDQVNDHLENGNADQALALLERGRQVIDRAVIQVREGISKLMDEDTSAQGLPEQLNRLVREFYQPGEPKVEFQTNATDDLILSRQQTSQILRIVREAILNCWRHAKATHISICLQVNGGHAQIRVIDDGCGFDPQRLPSDSRKHFGLQIMRARATRLGGVLEIESGPEQGTQLSLSWPVNCKD